MQEIKLPKRGQAMEEGLIHEWSADEGDPISVGDTLVIFETEKTTAEIEAEQDGVLLAKLVDAGETVPIGTTLGYVGTEAEDVPTESDSNVGSSSSVQESEEAEKSTEEADKAVVSAEESGPQEMIVRAAPSARRAARAHGVEVSNVGAALGVSQIRKEHIERYIDEQINERSDEEIRGSPAARRIANDRGIGITAVGEELKTNRVRMDDVERYVEQQVTTPPDENQESAESATSEGLAAPTVHETVPITGSRKVMFDRIQTVSTEYGSTTTIARVDVTELMSLIESLKGSWEAHYNISPSLTAFVIRAVAQSLPDFRILNAEVVDPSDPDDQPLIQQFSDINIGLAVDTDHGLVVPTIYHADEFSVSELGKEVIRLAKQARNRDLEYDQQQNATFTVSNAGTFGAYINTPQINPPQTGILGVCTVNEEPGIVNGEVIPRKMIHLSLTYDHRVVEGSSAVQFLQAVKSRLEEPHSLLS